MTRLERAQRAVVAEAKRLVGVGRVDDSWTLGRAVETLRLEERREAAARRKALKRYPLIDCKACGRRHRSNVDHVWNPQAKKRRRLR